LEVELINRERDVQRQRKDSKIKARYNKRYKEIRLEGRVSQVFKERKYRGLK